MLRFNPRPRLAPLPSAELRVPPDAGALLLLLLLLQPIAALSARTETQSAIDGRAMNRCSIFLSFRFTTGLFVLRWYALRGCFPVSFVGVVVGVAVVAVLVARGAGSMVRLAGLACSARVGSVWAELTFCDNSLRKARQRQVDACVVDTQGGARWQTGCWVARVGRRRCCNRCNRETKDSGGYKMQPIAFVRVLLG